MVEFGTVTGVLDAGVVVAVAAIGVVFVASDSAVTATGDGLTATTNSPSRSLIGDDGVLEDASLARFAGGSRVEAGFPLVLAAGADFLLRFLLGSSVRFPPGKTKSGRLSL